MDNRQAGLVRLTTRVDSETLDEIERLAKARRTNVAQVARCLIEDAIQALGNRRLKRIRRTMMPNLSRTENATHNANSLGSRESIAWRFWIVEALILSAPG